MNNTSVLSALLDDGDKKKFKRVVEYIMEKAEELVSVNDYFIVKYDDYSTKITKKSLSSVFDFSDENLLLKMFKLGYEVEYIEVIFDFIKKKEIKLDFKEALLLLAEIEEDIGFFKKVYYYCEFDNLPFDNVLSLKDKMNRDLLNIAFSNGNKSLVGFFLGIDEYFVLEEDYYEKNALDSARDMNHPEIVQLLEEKFPELIVVEE